MLKPRKRLSRKEIKEDKLVTYYVKAQKIAGAYGKQISYAGIAVIAVLLILLFMAQSKRKAEIAASGQLGIAELYYSQYMTQPFSETDHASLIEQMRAVADSYPGTESAGKAVFYQANLYFVNNDFDNAELHYRKYISDYDNNRLFGASSRAGIAACFESREMFLDAADWYQRAYRKAAGSFDAPDYLRSAARCFKLAENYTESRKMLELLVAEFPSSPIAEEGKFLLEML